MKVNIVNINGVDYTIIDTVDMDNKRYIILSNNMNLLVMKYENNNIKNIDSEEEYYKVINLFKDKNRREGSNEE